MAVRTLIGSDILAYRYDHRLPDKQRIAEDILRRGIASASARIPHQSILEFVAATTRGAIASTCSEHLLVSAQR